MAEWQKCLRCYRAETGRKQRTVRFTEPRERGLLGQRDDSMVRMCSVLMICLQFLIQNIFFLGIDSFILCVSRQLKSHIY